MKRISSVLALGAIASLTACGGGSGSSALPAAPKTPTAMQDVQFRITIPQSVRLSPKYISSSTQSAAITVAPAGGAPLAPVNINCTTSCSGTISAPVGSDLFDVKLYDATNATGNVLSHGSATQTIVAGTANTVNLTFGGVVKSIALGSTSGTVNAGTPVQIIVVGYDAAGKQIVGTANYDNAITLVNADTSGTTSLNTTTVTSPNTVVTLSYNGGSSSVGTVQITAAAAGAAAGSVSIGKGAGGPVVPSAVSFLSAGAGSIAASSTSATVAVLSEYQTAISSSPGSVAATSQGSFNLQIGSNLTPLSGARQSQTALTRATSSEETMGAGGTFRDSDLSNDWNAKYSALSEKYRGRGLPPLPTRAKRALPTVGTVQNFYISSSAIGASSGGYAYVPFQLVAISSHGLIWMDTSLSSTVLAYGAQIGTIFDNAYASDTANYGAVDYTPSSPGMSYAGQPCNDDGSASTGTQTQFIAPQTPGYINVVVASPTSLGTGVGGYFSSLNYMNQGIANCFSPNGKTTNPSNQLPMIVVGWFSDGTMSAQTGDPYELNEDLVRGTAHELQHLINFVNHIMISGQPKNDPRWLNEGLSVLSQDLASAGHLDIDDALRRGILYLGHPQYNSITGFLYDDGTTMSYNCSSCYGASYMFTRYMYDRFGGAAFTQGMTTGSTFGHASLTRISGYSDLAPLLGDFATALAVSNTGISTDPRYNFTNLSLHKTYVSPNGLSNKVFNGPTMLTVGAGSSASIAGMPAGAFAFYNVTGITGVGNAVKLTDTTTGTSPMALAGSIIQH